MKPCLHSFWASSASWRVRIALELKGIEYTYRTVNLLAPPDSSSEATESTHTGPAAFKATSPEYQQQLSTSFTATHNPLRQVPVFYTETKTLDETPTRITQSLPIIEYLEEAYPDTPSLLPEDALGRARARELAEMVNTGIQPLQNIFLLNKIEALLGSDARKAWGHDFIRTGLLAFEQQLMQQGGTSTFCVGDTPTIADLFMIPQLNNARRYDMDLTPFPTLLKIESACQALPAFQRAHPKVQPDAPGRT